MGGIWELWGGGTVCPLWGILGGSYRGIWGRGEDLGAPMGGWGLGVSYGGDLGTGGLL